MGPTARRRLRNVGNAAVPWSAGLFGAMIASDLGDRSGMTAAVGVFALSLVQAGALTRRRAHPEAVMAVVAVTGLAIQLIAPDIVMSVALLFALGSLAIARPPHLSLAGLVAAWVVSAVSFTTQPVEDPVFAGTVCVAVWALGLSIRSNRDRSREEALRIVAEERAHLEREVHDILAHGLSVMIVQAAAADDVFEVQPDAARTALRVIEDQGRDALAEIRRLLAPSPPAGGDGDVPSRAPLPGLGDLPQLAERLGGAGVELQVRHQGDDRDVPGGVGLSAFRIVQEAATNSIRHGRATCVEVSLRYRPDGLEIDVSDNGRPQRSLGPGASAPSGGRGLIGIRERARLHGGSVETGPLPDGGYAVHAWLPTGAEVAV